MTGWRISEAASLGLHAMVLVATSPARPLTAKQMAERLGVSEAHLAKVMQRLAHVGLVHSARGPHGGFSLAKPSDQTSLLEVYEAIDGELVDTPCLLGRPACGGACILGDLLGHVNAVIREHLSRTTLCGLARSFGRKKTESKRRAATTPTG